MEDLLQRETFRILFERTRFKRAQLDALLVKRYALENRLKLREALPLRDRLTSVGSMERSALQAETVVSESVATLILALGLGLVSPNVVESIPRIASLFQQSTTRKLSDDELERFLALVTAMLHNASHK